MAWPQIISFSLHAQPERSLVSSGRNLLAVSTTLGNGLQEKLRPAKSVFSFKSLLKTDFTYIQNAFVLKNIFKLQLRKLGRTQRIWVKNENQSAELIITQRNRMKHCRLLQVWTELRLKLQTGIDFKWKMKVVVAVKAGRSSCQLRKAQWKWQMAINYTGHYGQSVSN